YLLRPQLAPERDAVLRQAPLAIERKRRPTTVALALVPQDHRARARLLPMATGAVPAGLCFHHIREVRPIREFQAYLDRKSTRLNSSHQIISYAVFCLKKKKNKYEESPSSLITRLVHRYTVSLRR